MSTNRKKVQIDIGGDASEYAGVAKVVKNANDTMEKSFTKLATANKEFATLTTFPHLKNFPKILNVMDKIKEASKVRDVVMGPNKTAPNFPIVPYVDPKALAKIDPNIQHHLATVGKKMSTFKVLQNHLINAQKGYGNLKTRVQGAHAGFLGFINGINNAGFAMGNTTNQAGQLDQELQQKPKDTKKAGIGFGNLAKMLKGAGRTLAWFGFRLTMMGRMMTRFLTGVLSKALANFGNWEKMIQDVGFALAWMSAQGTLTDRTQQAFIDTISEGPKAAYDFQAAMTDLNNAFGKIGGDIAGIFVPAIHKLASILRIIWDEAGPQVIAVMESLVGPEGPLTKLFDLLEKHGGNMLIAFADGLTIAANAMTWLFGVLEPYLPEIAKFLGILIGLSPILVLVGLALFTMSVPLQALGVILGPVISLVSTLFGGFLGLMGGIPLLIAAFALAALGLDAFGVDVDDILDKIEEYFVIAADYIWGVLSGIDWAGAFETLKTFTSKILLRMAEWIGSAYEWAFNTFGKIDWEQVFYDLSVFAMNLLTWIFDLIGDIGRTFKGHFDKVYWPSVFESLVNFILGIGTLIANTIGTAVVLVAQNLPTWLKDWTAAFDKVWSGMKDGISRAVFKAIQGLLNKLPTWLKKLLGIDGAKIDYSSGGARTGNESLPTHIATEDELNEMSEMERAILAQNKALAEEAAAKIQLGVINNTLADSLGNFSDEELIATQRANDMMLTTAEIADQLQLARKAMEDATNATDDMSDSQSNFQKTTDEIYMRSIGDDIFRNMSLATKGYDMARNSLLGFTSAQTSMGIIGGIGQPTPITQTNAFDIVFREFTLTSNADIDYLVD